MIFLIMKGKLFRCGWCCPISHPVSDPLEFHSSARNIFTDPTEIVPRDPVTLKQICVHPATNKMRIFVFWSDTGAAINCSSSLLFPPIGRWLKIGVPHLGKCFPNGALPLGKGLFDGHQQIFGERRNKCVDGRSSQLISPSRLFHVNEELEFVVSHQSRETNAQLATGKR